VKRFIPSLFLCLLSPVIAGAASYTCQNNSNDPVGIRGAIDAGGTAMIKGLCMMGSSAIDINNAVAIQGGANFTASSSNGRYIFNVYSDNVSFTGMTFTNAGIEVPGIFAAARNAFNLTNNVFQDFTVSGTAGVGAAVHVIMIWKNSTVTGNSFQNIWPGGWSNGCSGWGSGGCQLGNEAPGIDGIYFEGGLDNTQIDRNVFNEIGYDAIKGFNNGMSLCPNGYAASGVSISYNTFTNVHRMGIEVQNSVRGDDCLKGGTYNGFAINWINSKINGNYYYHPAFGMKDTFALSVPVINTNEQVANNSLISDFIGNPTPTNDRMGYAIEDPTGTTCCGIIQDGGMIQNGNVISGDVNSQGDTPGWYAAVATYYGFKTQQKFENNLMCGPSSNFFIANAGTNNVVDQYNFKNSACPAGSGTALWASTLSKNPPSWTTPDNQSFPGGGNGTWSLTVPAVSLSIRWVQFFVDNSGTPFYTQEIQDVNTNFSADRLWHYSTMFNTSNYSSGSHTLKAVITDVSGATTALSQTFTVGTGGPTPPTIQSFTANPATVTAGQSSTLSWLVTNAPTLSISGVGDVSGKSSIVVTPTQTTVYTLTASNSGNSITKQTPVTVIPVTTPSASVSFVKDDSVTQGSWKGTYGSDGEIINNDSSASPSYAQVTFAGSSSYVWGNPTTDIRALQKAASSNRIASTWYTESPATSYTIDVNLTDGSTHLISLYALDFDSLARSERIDVVDNASQIVLDSRSLSSFTQGHYLAWNVKGHVVFRITNLNTNHIANAVISGIFFGGTSSVSLAAPSNLGANSLNTTFVTLNWTDNSNNETAFLIQRQSTHGGDPFVTLYILGANVTSYTDSTNLNAYWQYNYQVIASNASGNSSPSNRVTVQVGVPSTSSTLPQPILNVPAIVTSQDVLRASYPVEYSASLVGYQWIITPLLNANANEGHVASATSKVTETLKLSGLGLEPDDYVIQVLAVMQDGSKSPPASAQTKYVTSAGSSAGSAASPAVQIYPNPWRSDKHTGHPITFTGLSDGSRVKIFTTAGHSVTTLQVVGSEATWDPIQNNVASGIYLFVAQDPLGHKSKGKFIVIR
jgi:hypothetical protein